MKGIRRAAACLVALLMLVPVSPTTLGADADDYKDQLNSLSSKYDELEKQQKAIQSQIDKAKSEKDKHLMQKKQLDNQIYGVRQQITVLSDKITLLEQGISKKEEELQDQQTQIEDNFDLLKKRLRVMYKTGNASVLGLVLGAEDFTQFLSHAQVTARVAQHDRDLIEDMRKKLAEIKSVKDAIESDKVELEASKGQQAQKQNQLAQQLLQTQDQIQDIEALEKDYKANQAQLTQQMKEVQAEVDAIYAKIDSTGTYDGGIMLWPVAGYKTVTSDYGWRFGGTDFHTGIDIARTNSAGQGIYNKPILAAADGKVVFTQTSYVSGRGYGIYLIIDHGGGISTLYGHTSSLKVKVGETVTRGQTVAYVGSTGWSTGPHLHFEVRVNGKYTNPWPYLK
ncbi:MAG TPA: peptidoglycan DD-metalloendopeptidase family protein [Clostridia bacterium]|nr:peptidoglycan DD-metalloendopeptidase family protein [Clostridia bacterium]